MNGVEFQDEMLKRMSGVERDLAYVKGIIEGRDHKNNLKKERFALGISCIALLVSIVLVVTRFV